MGPGVRVTAQAHEDDEVLVYDLKADWPDLSLTRFAARVLELHVANRLPDQGYLWFTDASGEHWGGPAEPLEVRVGDWVHQGFTTVLTMRGSFQVAGSPELSEDFFKQHWAAWEERALMKRSFVGKFLQEREQNPWRCCLLSLRARPLARPWWLRLGDSV